MSERLWIKHPIAILTDGAERGIVVDGSRIVALVGRDDPDPQHDDVFDASRHVVLPGLVNTHHHFFQTLTRAHPAAINRELFPWLKALYPLWGDHLDRDSFRLATRLALTELLLSGCTTASDHLFVFPADMPDAVDIEVEEAAKLGMRVALTRGAINLGMTKGGIADERLMQDDDVVLADCERVIGRYHDRRPGAYSTVALAPCAPFNVTREMMCAAAELAEKHDCRLHTHLGETEDENDFCLSRFGMRPLDYLEEVGWLNDHAWLAHGIHFDDAEVARLGRHRVGICHCPTSNMVLASGICRTKELEAAGAIVGLGVDGSASNDSSNMMEAVRHALMIGRLRYDAATVTHLDALRWATEGSAACIGRSDIGRIAVGMEADLALFTLDELRFSGAGDPIAALVLCGAHTADRVMVGGNWRVIDSAPVGVDLARLRHEHGAAARAFLTAL
ncbi:8-oxoguanine deaminase [Mesorhizobium sp. BR1-1-16]|uniref:8-oxoguanine deaminase n=1 Tax=Mesorhizobium sp. BR1-1-16 TaxID=2876653 RepID=UPI001CCE29F0|nr:8-oxoguanine deaminase [Mesorhizobium sp. BR1-1-16]MBZ9935716.1 8-oxoguanine deaminase [Mesorhizobium sp. BR1-1-16]